MNTTIEHLIWEKIRLKIDVPFEEKKKRLISHPKKKGRENPAHL